MEFEIDQAMDVRALNMQVLVFDEDVPGKPEKNKIIGEATMAIESIIKGEIKNLALNLRYKKKDGAGTLALGFEFRGTFMDNNDQ